LDLDEIWAKVIGFGKIKILHPQKHSISYGYVETRSSTLQMKSFRTASEIEIKQNDR